MKLLEWHCTDSRRNYKRSYAMDYDLHIKFVIYILESSSVLGIFDFPRCKRIDSDSRDTRCEPEDRQIAHIEFNIKQTTKEMKEFAQIFRELLGKFEQPLKTLYTRKQYYINDFEEILLDMDGVAMI